MSTAMRERFGSPRVLPAINSQIFGREVSKLYLRPNPDSDGSIPSAGPHYCCPDIWPAGTQAIANYQTVLAGNDPMYGYRQESPNGVTLNVDNYIYVRAKNGATTTQTKFVRMYYAESAIIQWPAEWVGNALYTDDKSDQNNLSAPAGAVAVAERPFYWPRVPPPQSGNHYCLFAQINDNDNSNPFPDVTSPLDLGKFIQNNLGWGQRNVQPVDTTTPTWQYAQPLTIAQNIPKQYKYTVYAQATGYIGWSVAFSCSQTDDTGQQIALATTRIQQDGAIHGVDALLSPGFASMLTLYMYNTDGTPAATGANVDVGVTYTPDGSEIDAAISAGAVDWKLSHGLARQRAGRFDLTPQPVVPIGSYTYKAQG